MRQLNVLVLLLAVGAVPSVAKAGFVLEGSLGIGSRVDPDPKFAAEQNLMLAPGYALIGEVFRFELGLVGNRSDVESGDIDLQLRPMLVIDPPFLPLYVRGIGAIVNLTDSDKREFTWGAALGVGGSLAGLGVFGELGYIPKTVGNTFEKYLEARVGAFYHFD